MCSYLSQRSLCMEEHEKCQFSYEQALEIVTVWLTLSVPSTQHWAGQGESWCCVPISQKHSTTCKHVLTCVLHITFTTALRW